MHYFIMQNSEENSNEGKTQLNQILHFEINLLLLERNELISIMTLHILWLVLIRE